MYIQRIAEKKIVDILSHGKSVLLLGPRQTGKTTLINRIPASRRFTLANPQERLRYEKEPFALTAEVEQLAKETAQKKPLIIIDEIQKIPILMDAVQDLIDRQIATFVLTGSSARKLKRGHDTNLLPGRVIPVRLDPLCQQELLPADRSLSTLLLDGSLPEIILEENANQREQLLDAYVTIYLEEEIRSEALVRELGDFARFLEFAASESGRIVNFSKLSQEIGKPHSTISSYYQILEDCLVAERIEPVIESKTRRKLSKTQRYLLYDMGVRRVAAHEGRRLSREQMGYLFEQYVGLELIRIMRLIHQRYFLKYWRDPSGPEVDWIVETPDGYIPVEVKWINMPTVGDTKYLQMFLDEYPQAKQGFIICQTPNAMRISKNIIALPWDRVGDVFN